MLKSSLQRLCVIALVLTLASSLAFASAYNGRPKLVVIIVIDQFRGDYLERNHDQLGPNGFRLFLDKGAFFTDCNYNYANTRTGPGHATLGTGTYSSGHGLGANEWWDPTKKKVVTVVQDDTTKLIGIPGQRGGSSPHNLLASTLGDELKLATQGKARVFGVALKDRAAILTNGFSADAAYWIDATTGTWVTSSYYMNELPGWVRQFNGSKRADKYWNLDWKDESGKVLRSTNPKKPDGTPASFYETVGYTPFANDYELEFARELITNEKLGTGPATDLLVVSLSANDILGHKVGPDAPEERLMVLALDKQIADFISFIGQRVGLANTWIALSADHGVSPLPSYAAKFRIPATNLDGQQVRSQVNAALSSKFARGRSSEYVRDFEWPVAYLSEEAFAAVNVKEADAEIAVGEALRQVGMRGYYTRTQLARGEVPGDEMGRKYLHSYTPYGGWYVMGVPMPFVVGWKSGADHATPYSYDTHVPLGFYGLPFEPGVYRTKSEPVDLVVTLASLLGINAPSSSVGRVLTEALTSTRSNDRQAATPEVSR